MMKLSRLSLVLVVFTLLPLLIDGLCPPRLQCSTYCPFGKIILNDCETCECCPLLKPCPVECANYKIEYVANGLGCLECACPNKILQELPCPDSICPDNCPFGGIASSFDTFGCASCYCADEPKEKVICSGGRCSKACPLEERITYFDQNDCKKCDCNINCPKAFACNCQKYETKEFYKLSTGCLGCKCVNVCPPVTCPDNCQNGLVIGEDLFKCRKCKCGRKRDGSCSELCASFCRKVSPWQCKQCKCKDKNDDNDDEDDEDVDDKHKGHKHGHKRKKEKKKKKKHHKYAHTTKKPPRHHRTSSKERKGKRHSRKHRRRSRKG